MRAYPLFLNRQVEKTFAVNLHSLFSLQCLNRSVWYGGAQQKLFSPAYLGIAGMRAYAIHMRNMQSGIFRI